MSDALPLILLGAGGHAKVLVALAASAGRTVAGVCAPELAQLRGDSWRGIPILGDDAALAALDPGSCEVINGIGQLPGSTLRARLFARFVQLRFRFPAQVHERAWVAADAALGEGVQLMAGALIQSDVRIGDNSVVNTGASVDHDCVIGRDVHIAPGAVLCGAVRIGDGAFIGAGATVIQGVTVGAGALIGAGALVLRDLAPGARLLAARPA